jgi:hypothetical protein
MRSTGRCGSSRSKLFTSLPLESLDTMAIQERLREIGGSARP